MFQTYIAKLSSAKVTSIMGSKCSQTGTLITTLVCEYPRAIHAQLLTHRVFSKNSSSTRAVPIKAAIKQIMDNPAKQIWTSNQPGMQGNIIDDSDLLTEINSVVEKHQTSAFQLALYLGSPEKEGGLNIHKQNAGRYLEPFQNIRICLTSTEWENWDWLRLDKDAQPEIKELAELILLARNNLQYPAIANNEWHLPFIDRRILSTGVYYHHPETGIELSLKEAIELSMSICAQTSYRKEDASDDKTSTVIGRLFTGKKIHASPSEHQATPMPELPSDTLPVTEFLMKMPKGVTHIDRYATPWSGNFSNWIQYRQLIPNHDKAKF